MPLTQALCWHSRSFKVLLPELIGAWLAGLIDADGHIVKSGGFAPRLRWLRTKLVLNSAPPTARLTRLPTPALWHGQPTSHAATSQPLLYLAGPCASHNRQASIMTAAISHGPGRLKPRNSLNPSCDAALIASALAFSSRRFSSSRKPSRLLEKARSSHWRLKTLLPAQQKQSCRGQWAGSSWLSHGRRRWCRSLGAGCSTRCKYS